MKAKKGNYITQFNSTEIDLSTTTPELNGSKGHKLIEMKSAGLNVPSGVVITTEACNYYRSLDTNSKIEFMDGLMFPVMKALGNAQKDSATNLVSVRSGAPVSMPGMMDTILNVGAGYTNAGIGNKTSPLNIDCKKRFVDMFLTVVGGMKKDKFAPMLETPKGVDTLIKIIKEKHPKFKDVIRASIEAVFASWDNPRAKHFRKMNGIPEDLGTAVVIQTMVFGNFNDKSGAGVLFTRNPNTGDNSVYGNFLDNCQGEDVVSGLMDSLPIEALSKFNPSVFKELVGVGVDLENKYNDMQDIEFTVEDGKLFILQTRSGLRSAEAEVLIALDFLEDKKIKSIGELLSRGSIAKLRTPMLPAGLKKFKVAEGIPSGGSIATGRVAKSVQSVLKAKEPVILVSQETTPDDIAGMEKAVGIVTLTGGITSHAAVVSRGMNKTCVVGCKKINLKTLSEKEYMLVDGKTGFVYVSKKPFEVDLEPSLNVELVSRLLNKVDTSMYTVTVQNVQEAKDFEEHLFKIALSSSSISEVTLGEDLSYMAGAFDLVVIKNHLKRDNLSDFIGVPILKNSNVVDMIEEYLADDFSNMYFDIQDREGRKSSLPTFKNMVDLMNPEFYGQLTDDFILNIIGNKETFDDIREQLELDSRIVVYMDLLVMIEVGLNIG